MAALGGLVLAVPFAALLLVVADRWGPLQRLDVRLDDDLNGYGVQHGGYVTVLKAISLLGGPATFELLAALVAVLLYIRRQPRLATWLLVTVFGGGLLSTLVKLAVGRHRPVPPHPLAHAASASFPSGHALGVVVGAVALLLVGLPYVRRPFRGGLVGLAVLLVLAVGYSRLGLGLHYLSDVLGGYLLGAGWVALTTAAFAAWRRDRGLEDRPLTEGLEPAAPEPSTP